VVADGLPFEFVFQDNGSYMYADAPSCSDCTRVLDDQWISPEFELRGPRFDISMTTDGCLVASDRFVEACASIGGLEFRPIPAEPGFSVVDVTATVRLDEFENHIRFGVTCPQCGNQRFVVHDGPLKLAAGQVLPEGFSRSELVFGDTADFGPDIAIRFAPVVMADESTARGLKATELRGVHVIAPL
jgi:hypothetical protein